VNNLLIDRLRTKRQDLLEELLAVTQQATEERRPLTAEEMGAYDVLTEHVEKLNEKIETLKGQP
jgi:hypothetical protein